MKLTTPRLVLRDLRKGDAASITKYVSDREIAKNLLVVPHPYSLKDAKVFLALCAKFKTKRRREVYNVALELKSTGELIGLIGIKDIHYFNGTGDLGFWLGRPYHRQGLMSEAVAEVLKFAFIKLEFRRVSVCAFAENKASNGLIKKLGFKHEGIFQKSVRDRATGAIHDTHHYGLLKQDWLKRKPQTKSRRK